MSEVYPEPNFESLVQQVQELSKDLNTLETKRVEDLNTLETKRVEDLNTLKTKHAKDMADLEANFKTSLTTKIKELKEG
jgi:uncharacterized alpha-E superfamily protein